MRHHPTPEPSFVADLAAYDASLRCRWGVHSQRWLIERKMPPRSPAWLAERPLNPFGTGPRAKDLWAGWREGYVHVLSVDPSLLHWRLVAPALAETDRQQAGSWEALNRQMDAVDAQADAQRQRTVDTWVEAASHEAADRLMWLEGHTQAMPHEPSGVVPSDAIEPHDGFTVRIRKGRHGA